MPLSNILADVAAGTGYNVSNDTQLARCITLINDAADEIWKTNDLPNCLGEQIFNLGTENQQITLPHYILEPRAIRDYDSEMKMQQVDMRPRYGTLGWVHYIGYQWRLKQQEAPLAKDLLNVEPLTFVLPAASPEAFSINIEIRTPKAARTNETILFAAGDTSKTSVNLIEQVYAITKSDYTTYDCEVQNQSGEALGMLPNSELRTNYTLVVVLQKYEQQGMSKLVELLFKRSRPKMRFDTDRFPCGDFYDKGIFYKAMEIFYGSQEGDSATKKAAAFLFKYNQFMTGLTENKQEGIKMIMDFGTNRWLRVAERCGYPPYLNGVNGVNGMGA